MAFGGCADRLILHPTTEPVAMPGISRAPFATAPSGKIEIWTARSRGARDAEPRAFVLTFVGNASRGEFESAMAAEEWAAQPVEAWSVNYPGYGGSTGPARLRFIPPAALAAYDALAVHAAGRPIFLSGTSLGTAAALYVAANRPVAGIVLHNPPPLRSLILGRYGWWNLWLAAGPIALQVPSELDSVANARRVNVPAVFVLAGRDSIVPPRYQHKIVNACRGPRRIVNRPNADHNDPPEDNDAANVAAAIDWLWQTTAKK
jgi:pimeloyl-ACP methyl ester carboxylesterase